jgi:hypothetical protein
MEVVDAKAAFHMYDLTGSGKLLVEVRRPHFTHLLPGIALCVRAWSDAIVRSNHTHKKVSVLNSW